MREPRARAPGRPEPGRAHVFAVHAAAAGAAKRRFARQREAGVTEYRGDLGAPRFAQIGPARAEAGRVRMRIDRVGLEQLGGVAPQVGEGRVDAAARCIAAVGQPHDPVGSVLLVVARFLHGLFCDGRELGIIRGGQALPEQRGPGRDEQVAQHGEREIAARQFADRCVAVVVLVAQERELVFVVALGLELAGAREHRARLADQVERHVRERDVFFEHRRVAAPFSQALRQDQRGVTDAQQVLHVGRAVESNGCGHASTLMAEVDLRPSARAKPRLGRPGAAAPRRSRHVD